MASLLISTWQGMGSGFLAMLCNGRKIVPAPTASQAFIYGTAVNLADRFIEYQAKKIADKNVVLTRCQSTKYIIAVIALKILSPYVIRKLLPSEIPISFIHLENCIYLFALLDGEYELIGKRVVHNAWGNYMELRITPFVFEKIRLAYVSLFN